MSETNKSGRTPSDALVEILTKTRLLLLAISIFLVLFFVVYLLAEPGSAIEVFGIKYQKGKPIAEQPKAPLDESDTYVLPKNIEIRSTQKQGVLILDGTLSVLNDGLIGGMIVGPSVGKIRVASRGIDGTPHELTRPYQDEKTVLFLPGTYTEIELHGRVFAMTTTASAKGLVISISRVPRATLDLVSVKDLPIASVLS